MPETKKTTPANDYSDELDSLLLRIQDLKFDSPAEKYTDNKHTKLFDQKKKVLQVLDKSIDTADFDKLFSQTEIKALKETVKPLSSQENKLVDEALTKKQGQASQFKKVTVDYKDIYRLRPETWLNDEIINFYFELLAERSSTQKDLPSIYCFNTFFCSTLRDQGYAKVRRWTKRVDIFSKDLIFIPINQSFHWVLGVIDMKNKTVIVYDSLGGNHDYTLSLFLTYLKQEHLDKKKTSLDTSDWKQLTPKDIPRQGNMSDCGAFTCTFAECLSRCEPFSFSQQDMVPIRRRMILNIMNKKI
ncbi:hypothetical protein BDF21DRAFT_461645 [Thamnidium elegans]|nr:hypothetical protein BDF21DRAFT_461645 [Thamnidium elegans]